ncbi:2-phospho-L-lactate guanylyltransferase [Streptomyces sp. NPDC060194]|uniref:2-phospho-L-lactate guanylyltransferase n=1 Tax=Streptomyces sp. NPDC060194 TaxID=3347069 RepID=UPI003663A80F
METIPWTVVVPLKPLTRAKSRLARAVGEELRPSLALAFAQDTVAAALACVRVRDVVVVTDDPLAGAELAALGARIVPEPVRRPAARPPRVPACGTTGLTARTTAEDGLNAALAHGAALAARLRPGAPVAALNADLPALRPAELACVLNEARAFPRAFLADAAGIGTTLLSARPGVELAPAFGGASRARHAASGAIEISHADVDSVRRDVDTGADLRAAALLGLGPRTAAAALGPVPADRIDG